MKMIMTAYNHSVYEELLERLTSVGMKYHTCTEHATGVGGKGPHMGTNIWPSTNNIMYIAITTEALGKKVLAAVKDLKVHFREAGIQAWVWRVDEEI
jgi:hypothetical protein